MTLSCLSRTMYSGNNTMYSVQYSRLYFGWVTRGQGCRTSKSGLQHPRLAALWSPLLTHIVKINLQKDRHIHLPTHYYLTRSRLILNASCFFNSCMSAGRRQTFSSAALGQKRGVSFGPFLSSASWVTLVQGFRLICHLRVVALRPSTQALFPSPRYYQMF